jgi:cytidylate kinase
MKSKNGNPIVITIDGPAASGKSTVSRILADRHGWAWVSTGAFYRGLAYVAIAKQVPLDNEDQLATLCHSQDWEVRLSKDRTEVFMDNENITERIHTDQVGQAASAVSKFPLVRAHLLQAQRDCAERVSGLIAEGRDCGTVIFPDAQVKVFLTANAEDRALRRSIEKGGDVQDLVKSQTARDQQDSNRKAAPLKIPENGLVVDSSGMSIMDVVEHLDQIIRKMLALQ